MHKYHISSAYSSHVGNGIFYANLGNTMSANVLAPYVARKSAAYVDDAVFLSLEERMQHPAPIE